MTGQLDEALVALLKSALPGLFGGAPPLVSASASAGDFVLDASSQDAQASEPRPDDRTDQLPFNAGAPAGPYLLTQSPDTGARRVWLTTDLGDRIALAASEVMFDSVEPRRFTLQLRPERDLAGVTGVQVLYGVTAVFAKLKLTQSLALALQSADVAALDKAEALAVAVIALNRPQLVAAGNDALRESDYGAQIEIKTLHITKGGSPGAGMRRLELSADIEVKATRALFEGEGAPILRIRSPGSTAGPARPVDVKIDVEA
jgi:hypothetical protein